MKSKKQKYAQSRRTRNILFLSTLLLILSAIAADRAFFYKPRPAATDSAVKNTDDKLKYHGKTFTVVNAVDGDTVDINTPDGEFANTRIRLLGIDTPETDKSPGRAMYFGDEASEFTRSTAVGKKVTVIMDDISKPRDKYNRLLCYLKFADGTILNELLIAEGFAYADRRFEHSFYEKYVELEHVAKEAKKGLWKNAKSEQIPLWLQKINHE